MNLDGTAARGQPVLRRGRRHQRAATTSSRPASATRSAARGGRPTAPTTRSRTGTGVDRLAKVVARPELRLGRHRREHDATSPSTTGTPRTRRSTSPSSSRRRSAGSGFPIEKMDHAFVTESRPDLRAPARRSAASGSSSSSRMRSGDLRRHHAGAADRVHRHRAGQPPPASPPGPTASTSPTSTRTRATNVAEADAHLMRIRYVGAPGYPRPKGATPTRVALVPAYQACTGSEPEPRAAARLSVLQPAGADLRSRHDRHRRRERQAHHLIRLRAGRHGHRDPSTPADEADVTLRLSAHRRAARSQTSPTMPASWRAGSRSGSRTATTGRL